MCIILETSKKLLSVDALDSKLAYASIINCCHMESRAAGKCRDILTKNPL